MKQDGPDHATWYGPMRAAWVSLLRPVQAVKRADHLPLGWAWAVHAAGAVMLGVVVLLLVIWDLNRGGIDPEGLYRKSTEVLPSLWGVADDPRAWAALIAVVLVIELTWAVSAAVSMSWCARDEKYRYSYARALRRLMLLTPHLAAIVGFLGGVLVWMHNRPRWRVGMFNGLNPEGLLVWLLVFAPMCLWALRVVLKALGAHPAPAMSRWPLRCEGCGYELAGMDHTRDCPECGQAIAKTLSREARPGIEPAGGVGWWLSQTYQAIRRPIAFGRRMHVMSADNGHRRCLGMTVAAQVLLTPFAWVGLTLLYSAIKQTPLRHLREPMLGLVMICIAVSLMIIATTAGAVVLIAGLAGATEGRHLKRNLMPVAVRAAGYLSGFAVVWAAVFWCSVAVTMTALEFDLLPVLAARYNIAGEKIVAYWHYGVTLVGILLYGVLIERVTRAARYANW